MWHIPNGGPESVRFRMINLDALLLQGIQHAVKLDHDFRWGIPFLGTRYAALINAHQFPKLRLRDA